MSRMVSKRYKTKELLGRFAPYLFRQKKLLEGGSARDLGTADYLTVEEAALVAGVSRTTVNSWIRKGFLSTRNVGKATWISRKELENRAGKQRRVQKGGTEDGNHT